MYTHDKDVKGFNTPTALPKNNTQSSEWQRENVNWWENHPMRYDWKKDIGFDEFSKEFYLEIDRRFFSEIKICMPWENIPFDPLINFDGLSGKDILEIGVGNGSHAQLLARYAKSYVGIDITEYAVRSTSERMKKFQIPNAQILQMDAEEMQFHDNTFDLVWSWGVIHHCSNTEKVLKQMKRVLKPGGMAITMVYHKNIWNYYIIGGFFRGIMQGNLFKTKSLHKTIQNYTDGALARFYTISEWNFLVSQFFITENTQIYGSKAELFPIPGGKLKNILMTLMPNTISRFLTNRFKLGTFLVSTLKRDLH